MEPENRPCPLENPRAEVCRAELTLAIFRRTLRRMAKKAAAKTVASSLRLEMPQIRVIRD
jgi:hypothetical protein